MCELSPVPFHGDTIYCIEHDGQPYAPMRPIVENLGIDWSTQAAKFRANKERWGVAMIPIPSEPTVGIIPTVAKDGKEREMLCMPVRKLPAWLASINPKKVRPELRAKIELYQNECDDALWNYWINGMAVKPDTPADTPAEQSNERPYSLPEYLKPLSELQFQHVKHLKGHERAKTLDALRMRLYRKLGVSAIKLLKPEQVEAAIAAWTRPVASSTSMPQEPIAKGNFPSNRVARMHAKVCKNLRDTARLIEVLADEWDACASPRGGAASLVC